MKKYNAPRHVDDLGEVFDSFNTIKQRDVRRFERFPFDSCHADISISFPPRTEGVKKRDAWLSSSRILGLTETWGRR